MGYSELFTGYVTVTPPLNAAEVAYLQRFSYARRRSRANGPYYCGGGMCGQDLEPDVFIDEFFDPPKGQPGFWCDLVPSDDGTRIGWNGAEKARSVGAWMAYLIDTFLKPGAMLAAELAHPVEGRYYAPEFEQFTFDHTVDGAIEVIGEDFADDSRWMLFVERNVVRCEGPGATP